MERPAGRAHGIGVFPVGPRLDSQARLPGKPLPPQAKLRVRAAPPTRHTASFFPEFRHIAVPQWVAFGQSQPFRPHSPSPCKTHCEGGVGAPRAALCVLEPGRETNQKAISKNSQHRVGTVWVVASSHGPPGWPAGDEGTGMSCLPDPDRPDSPGGPQWTLYPGGV